MHPLGDSGVLTLNPQTPAGFGGSHKETKFLELSGSAQQNLARASNRAYISAEELSGGAVAAAANERSWWHSLLDSLAGFPQVSLSSVPDWAGLLSMRVV